MEKYNLKPCPFCGNRADFEAYMPSKMFYVCCQTCEAMGFTGTKEVAAEKWNTRTIQLDDYIEVPANVQKLNNERGAGRKPKLSSEQKKEMIFWREAENRDFRTIAHFFNVSVGTVHKIISEHKKAV